VTDKINEEWVADSDSSLDANNSDVSNRGSLACNDNSNSKNIYLLQSIIHVTIELN
jgi:hypothetical protein